MSESDSDLESGSSTPSHETVYVNMPKDKVRLWNRSVGTKPRLLPGAMHNHPLLAASRFVLERDACQRAMAIKREGQPEPVVVDVGAAPKRTAQYLGLRGRYLSPDLQPGDRSRSRDCPGFVRDQMCNHLFEECTHILDADGNLQQDTVFVCVHSAYYLDRLTLWRRLQDPRCLEFLVVGHTFEQPYGGFSDEANWEQHGSRITMRVRGQSAIPYEHDVLPWTVDWRGPLGEAFEAERIRSLFDFTHLWSIRAVVRAGPQRALMWADVVTNPLLSGPVQFSNAAKGMIANDAVVSKVRIDLDRVEKVGNALYTTSTPLGGTPVEVTVPVDMIASVAIRALNNPRTPELLRDLTFMCQRYGKTVRIPVQQQPIVAATAVAIGMVCNLEVEMDLLNTVHERFDWRYRAHSSLVAFQRLSVWRCWKLVAAGVFFLLPPVFYTLFHHDPLDDLYSWLVAMGAYLALLAFVWCSVTVARFVERSATSLWRRWYEEGVATHSPLFAVPSLTERLLPGSRNIRQIGETDPGLTVVFTEDSSLSSSRVVPRAHLAGIVTDTSVVNVLEPDAEAEASGIAHRMAAIRPCMSWDLLPKLREVFHEPEFDAIRSLRVDRSPSGFVRWLNAQKPKFATAVIDGWRICWNKLNLGSRELIKRAGTPFLKLEKNAKPITPAGQDPIKARLIQPPSDEGKVITGPLASQMYARATAVWDGKKFPILYASGRSTDYIGSVVDGFIASCGGEDKVVGITMDCSNYDATLRHEQQFSVFEGVYEPCGLTDNDIGWFSETLCRGKTPHGVVYSIERAVEFDTANVNDVVAERWFVAWLKRIEWPYEMTVDGTRHVYRMVDMQMSSGRMDTNLMDTIYNVAAFLSYLKSVKITRFLMLACGDDNFILCHREDFTQENFVALERHLSLLGLKAEGTRSESRHEWEFCSKLFWFGIDKKSGVAQTVLACKPGRAISRMGITVSAPNQANIASTALSLRQDAGHVPFVRVVANRVYEICARDKIRPKGREWDGLRASKAFNLDPRNFSLSKDRYGKSEADEEELKQLVKEVERLPVFVHWDPAADMALADA